MPVCVHCVQGIVFNSGVNPVSPLLTCIRECLAVSKWGNISYFGSRGLKVNLRSFPFNTKAVSVPHSVLMGKVHISIGRQAQSFRIGLFVRIGSPGNCSPCIWHFDFLENQSKIGIMDARFQTQLITAEVSTLNYMQG